MNQHLSTAVSFAISLAISSVHSVGFSQTQNDNIPIGLGNNAIRPACDPRRLEDSIIGKNLTTRQYFKTIRSYFSRCSGDLTTGATLGVPSLMKFSSYEYAFLKVSGVTRKTFILNDGTKIPAIVALKNDSSPRPLVIVKCGVFCAMGETASMKNYLMNLFDQSPFNIILLANHTGLDYLSMNKTFSIGGFAEGREVVELGRWIQNNWEYKDRISSMHLMGISLGGNAAVFGAAYNDLYPNWGGQKVYTSVGAICPVVNLKASLESLFGSLVVGKMFADQTKDQFFEAKKYITDVPDLITTAKFPSARMEIPYYIAQLAATSLSRRGISTTPDEFFKNNNFWNLDLTVTTPMLVWASEDDMVVNNELNAAVFADHPRYRDSNLVGLINLRYGNHCAFNTAYGVQATTAVLKSWILQNSPEFTTSYSAKKRIQWPYGFSKLKEEQEHISQIWSFQAKSEYAKVTFRIFDWSGSDKCAERGPYAYSDECISEKTYNIPIKDLSELGARTPQNAAEAQAFTREFNGKTEFRTTGGPLTGSSHNQFFIYYR